jgi:hypothetical protein
VQVISDSEYLQDLIQQNATRNAYIAGKVDAVSSLVLCKDCEHSIYDGVAKELWCNHNKGLSSVLLETDFCSYGEKRGDACR